MKTSDTSGVLIVDDSMLNIEILGEILEPEHRVFFAGDGETALKILQREAIDLVLLDILMPGMDGYEVCRRIKGAPETASIPVIFITAKNEVEDETKGFELGAVDYITKPVSPPIVRARVRTHLELKAQRDYLQRLSAIDGLTGVANRRRFDELLHQEWQRGMRHATPLALLMIDIDFFKRFNDTYGHVAGDDCLRAVARVLAEVQRRPGDLVSRYGGEEFAVIVPECSVDAAIQIGESLRERVEATPVPLQGSVEMPSVTLSIGAGVMIPHSSLKPEEFIKQVDALLYQAKEGGRNRVVGRSLEAPTTATGVADPG